MINIFILLCIVAVLLVVDIVFINFYLSCLYMLIFAFGLRFICFIGLISKFLLFERILTFFHRTLDALMFFLIIGFGFWIQIAVTIPLYWIMCSMIAVGYERFVIVSGHDPLLLQYFRDEFLDKKFDRPRLGDSLGFKRWVFDLFEWVVARLGQAIISRRWATFIFGSLFHLDPDLVTLLLRRGDKTTVKDLFVYCLPSSAISIFFWGSIYWIILEEGGGRDALESVGVIDAVVIAVDFFKF